MSDIKKINRQLLVNLVVFITIILVAITIMIVANVMIENENLEYLIYFPVLVSLIFIISTFKNRIDQISNLSYLIKIRANQAPSLMMNHTKHLDTFEELIQGMGFIMFSNDQMHTLYYRLYKDDVKKIIKRYVLELIVLIDKKQEEFFLDIVDSEIGKIQQKHLKDHKKINRMIITQIKEVNDLDEKTKDSIKEIVFFRTNLGIISTINIGLHKSTNKAVMLYSELYSPSIHYTKHINLIKKII
jgi:hypothetical protein